MPDSVTAVCAGGPLDGQTVTVGTPDGFLAADKAASRAWLYRFDGRAFQLITDHDDSLIYPQGPATGERALDWPRLDEAPLDVVPVTDAEENYAGVPVLDPWSAPEVSAEQDSGDA